MPKNKVRSSKIAKYCRCIQHVKKSGRGRYNPWAVCSRIRPRRVRHHPCRRFEK